MTSVDRIQGLSGSLAVKAPVRVATTASITLNGLQTVDGVALAEGDRVLVKDQATAGENGIYDASSGPWTRSKDFDGANDFVQGTQVLVAQGTVNAGQVWKLSTASPSIGGALAFGRVSFTDGVSAADVGTVGDGVTDDTAALQAAITLGTGKRTFIPSGTYIVSSTLTLPSNTHLVGEGTASIIKLKSATNTHVMQNSNYASGTNADVVIDGVVIDGNVANQTNNGTQNKHGIRLQNCDRFTLRNSIVRNVGTDCVNMITCDNAVIRHNELHGAYNHAVTFQECHGLIGESNTIHDCGSKTDATGFTASGHAFIGVNVQCDNVRLVGNYVYDMGDSCLRNERAGEGWVISNNLVVNSGKDSIKIMGTTGANPRPVANVISGNVVIDAGNDGIVAMGKCVVTGNYVLGTGKNTAGAGVGKQFASASGIKVIDNSYNAQIVGNYCEDGLYAGIYLSGTRDCQVRDNYCYLNGQAGIAAFDSNRMTIEGNDCLDNGVLAGGFGIGIRATLSGAALQENTTIRNNKSRNTTTTNQSNGIYIAGTTTNGFYVQQNDVRGNSSIGILNSAVGSGNIVTQNIGFVTENSGSSTITSVATSVTVSHGLSATPSAAAISVTPSSTLGNATEFFISNVTSTTFRINVDVAPGADITFVWQIRD